MTDRERAQRNMNPHAEARLAMAMWPDEYAHKFSGGSMDFWDHIGAPRQRICKDVMNDIIKALETTGRAP